MKTCRVTIRDMDGIDHTAQVTADTLFEAVARGIVALKANSWTGDLVQGSAQVMVSDTPVEHTVRLREFHNTNCTPASVRPHAYPTPSFSGFR